MSDRKAIPEGATWVRFPRFIGDAAMQLPVLRLMRQIGVGPLVVWGPGATLALVEGTWFCDAVVPDEGKPGPRALARILREHRAARSIHFPKSVRPALAAWLARVPERIGVNESLAGIFNTHSGPFWEAEGPFLLRYHAVLKKRWPDLPPMPYADFDSGVSIEAPDQPYLCLMPGSTWPSKAWLVSYYRELLLRARREGFAVVVLGAPNESEVCAAVAGEEGLNVCGKTTLKEAAAWLRGARAALGNDSGLSHLAAACGAPTLAIYGATDPRGSTPWGPRSQGLRRSDVPCAPCFLPDCSVEGHPCLARIQPGEAWDALVGLISA
jgi:heptosyltransferase-2